MKKTLLITLQLLFLCQFAFAQDFITTWVPSIFGTGEQIRFDAITAGSVAYTWQTTDPTSPVTGSGTFTTGLVLISGIPAGATVKLSIQSQNFRRFKNNAFSDSNLVDINQWGSVPWSSFASAFEVVSFFNNGLQQVSATDIPNLSGVTDISNMFAKNGVLNSPFNINFWNVSTITNMSGMFSECNVFNQALSQWNTSNVIDMSKMFNGASAFNQNIGTWNTSNVTNMSKMFQGAFNFNRNLNNWDTGNVTNMFEMFGNSNILTSQ